jgi:hypothetical protein
MGLSKSKFPKDDYFVRLRIDFKNKVVFILRDDNYLVLFKKEVKANSRMLMQRRARVWLMKFCGFVLPKKKDFTKRGKHVKGCLNR